MGFHSFAAVLLGLALMVLLVGARILSRTSWIGGWIRGNMGLSVVALSGAVCVFAFNVFRFDSHDSARPLATVAIEHLSDSRFRLSIANEHGVSIFKDVEGANWSMAFRIVTWGSLPTSFGLPPGYRAERLTGSTAVDGNGGATQTQPLMEPDLLFDCWPWLEGLSVITPWFRADRYETSGVPMLDGAAFTIHLTSNGLLVHPINQRGELALTPKS